MPDPLHTLDRRVVPVLSVITPTFNECENVGPLIDQVEAALGDLAYEIIVVDDDSPDLTWQRAEEIARTHPSVRVLRRFADPGLSPSVIAGMSMARGAVLAVIDADLQHDPSALPAMVERITGGHDDVVVGTRAAEGGSYGEWSAGRRFVSWVATLIARLFLRVPVTDPMSGFFAVSRETFDRMAPVINPQGFKILLEFIGRRIEGLRVSEVGYTFRNRVHGETKMSPSVIRSYLLAVVELRLGRQVKGQFVLYALVGLSGAVVNFGVFGLFEAFHIGDIDLGFSRAVRWSLLIGIAASIVWNFVLNNYFTFWERRFRPRQVPLAFATFTLVSLFGVFLHVSVFQFLDANHWGVDVLGNEVAQLLHNAVGFIAALVSNYFLNVNYTWRRRSAG